LQSALRTLSFQLLRTCTTTTSGRQTESQYGSRNLAKGKTKNSWRRTDTRFSWVLTALIENGNLTRWELATRPDNLGGHVLDFVPSIQILLTLDPNFCIPICKFQTVTSIRQMRYKPHRNTSCRCKISGFAIEPCVPPIGPRSFGQGVICMPFLAVGTFAFHNSFNNLGSLRAAHNPRNPTREEPQRNDAYNHLTQSNRTSLNDPIVTPFFSVWRP